MVVAEKSGFQLTVGHDRTRTATIGSQVHGAGTHRRLSRASRRPRIRHPPLWRSDLRSIQIGRVIVGNSPATPPVAGRSSPSQAGLRTRPAPRPSSPVPSAQTKPQRCSTSKRLQSGNNSDLVRSSGSPCSTARHRSESVARLDAYRLAFAPISSTSTDKALSYRL